MVVRMEITTSFDRAHARRRVWVAAAGATAVIICFAVLSSCASGDVTVFDHEPVIVRDYTALLTEIEMAVESSSRLSSTNLGTVTYGSFEQPMVAVHFEPKIDDDTAQNDPVPAVLIIGGVHGNEPAGAAWAVELIRDLAGNPG